jgi:hypothetical protein
MFGALTEIVEMADSYMPKPGKHGARTKPRLASVLIVR